MTDLETLETLDIPDSSLEPVRRSSISPKLPYPALTVFTSGFRLNIHASRLFSAGDRLRIMTAPDYIVFQKTENRSSTHHVIRRNETLFISARPLVSEKKLKKGVYRLYKCRQGYAIKRNEPLEVY